MNSFRFLWILDRKLRFLTCTPWAPLAMTTSFQCMSKNSWVLSVFGIWAKSWFPFSSIEICRGKWLLFKAGRKSLTNWCSIFTPSLSDALTNHTRLLLRCFIYSAGLATAPASSALLGSQSTVPSQQHRTYLGTRYRGNSRAPPPPTEWGTLRWTQQSVLTSCPRDSDTCSSLRTTGVRDPFPGISAANLNPALSIWGTPSFLVVALQKLQLFLQQQIFASLISNWPAATVSRYFWAQLLFIFYLNHPAISQKTFQTAIKPNKCSAKKRTQLCQSDQKSDQWQCNQGCLPARKDNFLVTASWLAAISLIPRCTPISDVTMYLWTDKSLGSATS